MKDKKKKRIITRSKSQGFIDSYEAVQSVCFFVRKGICAPGGCGRSVY